MRGVKLVIVHYHFRPGGVRRVIELAVPHLVGALVPRINAVVLATGEAPDALWLERLRAGLGALPVVVRLDPALGYVAEHRMTNAGRTRRLRRFFAELFDGPPQGGSVVWAHNQCLGRNLALTRELVRACTAREIPLVLHHHDWWFDNRWQRWAEMRRAGFRSLAQVAATMLPAATHVRHAAINQPDAATLRRHFGRQAAWLPNLTDVARRPVEAQVRRARRWLTTQLGEAAPVWLVPCRLLRRKNLAEALLLTRWLRPEAWLVTTGGVSSAEEADYARQLELAADRAGWKLCLGVLAGDESGKPSVPELMAASEAILLTSVMEGFGLPYLEAAAARRPLLARALPNIAPDLARFGFRFPQTYDEILIDSSLFDWAAELERQRALLRAWRQALPRECRRLAGQPALLAAAGPRRPVAFSRLTLTAQLEVLRQPLPTSWRLCAPLNPALAGWRERAARGALGITRWPHSADEWLNGATYAAKFTDLMAARPRATPRPAGSGAAQTEFIRRKLRPENLYPLTWSAGA
jgi:glycosyltransferase involved in cell wall biosynthesis